MDQRNDQIPLNKSKKLNILKIKAGTVLAVPVLHVTGFLLTCIYNYYIIKEMTDKRRNYVP